MTRYKSVPLLLARSPYLNTSMPNFICSETSGTYASEVISKGYLGGGEGLVPEL